MTLDAKRRVQHGKPSCCNDHHRTFKELVSISSACYVEGQDGQMVTMKVVSLLASGPEKPWLSSAIRKQERVKIHSVAIARPAERLLPYIGHGSMPVALPNRNAFHSHLSLSHWVSLAISWLRFHTRMAKS